MESTSPTTRFAADELALIQGALQQVSDCGDPTLAITLRREPVFRNGGSALPTVMGIFVPASRTAVLFDAAFAGPGSGLPLTAPEAILAVLGVSLLGDPALRARWLKLIGAPETAPEAAAIVDARAAAMVLAGRDGRLALESLGPETAFALAYAWATSRATWLTSARADLARFFATVRGTSADPVRC